MFNKLSNWVTGLIVLENKVRNRATLLVNFIKMAHYFKKINNFHLLTAVLCGINSAAVSRLSWTFKRVPKRYKQVRNSIFFLKKNIPFFLKLFFKEVTRIRRINVNASIL